MEYCFLFDKTACFKDLRPAENQVINVSLNKLKFKYAVVAFEGQFKQIKFKI